MTGLARAVLHLVLVLAVAGEAALSREPVSFKNPYNDGYVLLLWQEPEVDREINQILERVWKSGARHISVPLFGCQSDLRSHDVGGCELRSRSKAIHLVEKAISYGFQTTLLPILVTKEWEWRGFFEPHDVDAWFKSYTAWIVDLAIEASRLGVAELVVATEFVRLNRYEDHWRKVLDEVRRVFSGPLVITVNWDEPERKFWDAADAIGVSAYYPLSQNNNPSQKELQKDLDEAWRKRRSELLALSQRWKRPLYFTELGYFNGSSTAKTPWAHGQGDRVDDELQAMCFEAFKKAWQFDRSLVRVNIWATDGAASDEAVPPRIEFDPFGKRAEHVLREFFKVRRGDL